MNSTAGKGVIVVKSPKISPKNSSTKVEEVPVSKSSPPT